MTVALGNAETDADPKLTLIFSSCLVYTLSKFSVNTHSAMHNEDK